jgi:hypothetical protein
MVVGLGPFLSIDMHGKNMNDCGDNHHNVQGHMKDTP